MAATSPRDHQAIEEAKKDETMQAGRISRRDCVEAALLALSLVVSSFALQGHLGIGLADEGYLWYGSWRTAAGELPMREFAAYDPGRYFWTAAWGSLFGHGIIGLRLSAALFQALGLTLGLLVLRQCTRSRLVFLLGGPLLLVWMYPREKVFESSLAMAAVYFGVGLLRNRSISWHFAAGCFVGIAAFFGRNHGLYASLALGAIALLAWQRDGRTETGARVASLVAGTGLGYSPMILLWLAAPGFFEGFIGSIAWRFEYGATNIARPVPLPLTADFGDRNVADVWTAVSTGLLFLLAPLVSISVLLLASPRRMRTGSSFDIPLVACIVSIPYLHHAFSRADLVHLAGSIHPFLLATLTLPFLSRTLIPRIACAALLALVAMASLTTVVRMSPAWQHYTLPATKWSQIEIGGDSLTVRGRNARLIESVRRISDEQIPAEESIFIAPFWPGLYPILGRRAPVKELIMLSIEPARRQHKMIGELDARNVNWALLSDWSPEGRSDLSFENSHSLVWSHLDTHFEPADVPGLLSTAQLLRRVR